MARKRKDCFLPHAFAHDIHELCSLTDVQRILTGTEGEDGREAAIQALASIADRVDALYIAVQEARE